MWAIENKTPYKADRTWGRDQNGLHEWIVAVKATFDIESNGQLSLADEQLDPLIAPEYNGDDGVSSLKYDADLVSLKPTTDVVINGTAYAPNGQPSSDFLVSANVANIDKSIRVLGNRTWKNGTLGVDKTDAEPIAAIPITYERAFGGYDDRDPDPKNHRLDARNPFGCGVAADPDYLDGQAVHNFEYPDGNAKKSGPAGFGAIDSFWSPRRELQGTYDESWKKNRYPLVPSDWKPESLQCAPEDQRSNEHLRGGERVELTNLTPEGELIFALPKIRPAFKTTIDGRTEFHQGKLNTVIIEPDERRVLMVWVTTLQCRNEVDYLDETIVYEKKVI